MIERGDWLVSDIARNAYDLEGKVIGTIGAGRIGYRLLLLLQPFNTKELLYYDYAPLPEGQKLFEFAILISDILFLSRSCEGRQCPPCSRFKGIRLSGTVLLTAI